MGRLGQCILVPSLRHSWFVLFSSHCIMLSQNLQAATAVGMGLDCIVFSLCGLVELCSHLQAPVYDPVGLYSAPSNAADFCCIVLVVVMCGRRRHGGNHSIKK